MKRFITPLLLAAACFSLVACGGWNSPQQPFDRNEPIEQHEIPGEDDEDRSEQENDNEDEEREERD
jgi:hypothetical protein